MFFLKTIAGLRDDNNALLASDAALRENVRSQQARLKSLRDERDAARIERDEAIGSLKGVTLSRDTYKALTDADALALGAARNELIDLRRRFRQSERERCEADRARLEAEAKYRDLRMRLAEVLMPMPEDGAEGEGEPDEVLAAAESSPA